jgi:hypothetical protein
MDHDAVDAGTGNWKLGPAWFFALVLVVSDAKCWLAGLNLGVPARPKEEKMQGPMARMNG